MKSCIPDKGLIVALDLPGQKDCLEMARTLSDCADIFKIPTSLALDGGTEFIKRMSKLAPIFIDLKLFDIPNTMKIILEKCAEMGVSIVTVHSLMGLDHLTQVNEHAKSLGVKILGVTLLTSLESKDLPVGEQESCEDIVLRLANLNLEAGSWGIVSSALEAEKIKKMTEGKIKIVCPGIRKEAFNGDDQKRMATPEKAGENGVDFIVVGRPITKAGSPEKEAREIKERFLKSIRTL